MENLKLGDKNATREEGCYYFVTFYNGVERIVIFTDSQLFESFKGDRVVNDEIEYWQKILL